MESWMRAKLNRIGFAITALFIGCFILYATFPFGPEWVTAGAILLAVGGLFEFVWASISLLWHGVRGNWQVSARR
jgi:hypothetical protein